MTLLLRDFSFGGIDFSKWFVISKVTMPFLSKENSFYEVGNAAGSRLLSSRVIKNEIKIEGTIINQRSGMTVQDTKDEMIRALNSEGTKRLIFNQLADRYFNAIFEGSAEYDATDDDITELELTFVVPEGVAYAIHPTIYSNVDTDVDSSNLVLDPEFLKRDKYWKPWTMLLDEKYNGSNILRADISADYVGENDPESGNWLQINDATTRYVKDLKVGDPVSIGAAVRIVQTTTTQRQSMKLILEEWDKIGGTILKRHSYTVDSEKIGEWQTFVIENIKVSNERTKALNLALGAYDGAIVDYSEPQFNLGEALEEYIKTTAFKEDVSFYYNGTFKTPPILKMRMNGENGVCAFVNSNGGLLQFGNPEETDVKTGARSDKVLHDLMRVDQRKWSLNKGARVYPNYLSDPNRPNKVQGSLDWKSYYEGVKPQFVSNPDSVWGGPMMQQPLVKNSNNQNTGNFEFKNRFDFVSSVRKQARIQFTLENAVSPGLSVCLRDSSSNKNELIFEGYLGSKCISSTTLNRNKFNGSFFEASITRLGSKVTFKIVQIKKLNGEEVVPGETVSVPMTLPDAENMEITGISTWFMRFGNTDVAELTWTDCKFNWVNVSTISNIPNYFNDGDILEVDIAKPAVYLNDAEISNLHSIGNQWSKFWIEGGATTINPIVSDWALPAEFEIEYRKAWL